jgi:predicted glycosyltransferase
MKYLFELNHPKHYYQFKYVMQALRAHGNEIMVLARDKDVLLNVLQEEGVPYIVFGKHRKSMSAKILGTFGLMVHYVSIVRKEQPDVFVSKASWYGTATAKLFHKKSVIFPDSEVVKVTNKYVVPLCTKVVTPRSFQLDYGEKHSRVDGIFEDCYLSPQVYHADTSVVEKYGLKRPYAIVRFVGWFANHDVGNSGFTLEEKVRLVKTISQYMTVYISSENALPDDLVKYKLPTPASLIHDVLSSADLYIGDSQTMAAEAALLGTPAIRSNSFVGPNDMSNFIMLQEKYGMLHNVAKPADAIALASQLSKTSRKQEWIKKRDDYYEQIGDINAKIVDILENL